MPKVVTVNEYKNRLKEKHPDEFFTIIEYKNMLSPSTIKCDECGSNIDFNKAEYALNAKTLCKKCHPQKDKIIRDARERFKNFVKECGEWEILSDMSKIHSKDLVECRCKKCGRINKKLMSDYMRGKKCKCIHNKVLKTTAEFKEEIDEEYELLSEYINANTYVLMRHKTCGFIYKVTPHNFLCGKRCPKCMRSSSKGEKKIEKILSNLNIEYEIQKTIKINDHLLRMDFYIPSKDIYIEYQGEQHYHPIPYFGGEKRFKIQQEYDKLKKTALKDKLFLIKYDRYDFLEEDLKGILKIS